MEIKPTHGNLCQEYYRSLLGMLKPGLVKTLMPEAWVCGYWFWHVASSSRSDSSLIARSWVGRVCWIRKTKQKRLPITCRNTARCWIAEIIDSEGKESQSGIHIALSNLSCSIARSLITALCLSQMPAQIFGDFPAVGKRVSARFP